MSFYYIIMGRREWLHREIEEYNYSGNKRVYKSVCNRGANDLLPNWIVAWSKRCPSSEIPPKINSGLYQKKIKAVIYSKTSARLYQKKIKVVTYSKNQCQFVPKEDKSSDILQKPMLVCTKRN